MVEKNAKLRTKLRKFAKIVFQKTDRIVNGDVCITSLKYVYIWEERQ